MIAFRRPKSLKDILVRLKVIPRQESLKGKSRPCKKTRCQTCKLMPIAQTFKARSGAISAIKGRHACKTTNALHLMTCNVCNKQWVGEMSMALNKWMNLHRSGWNTRKFNRSLIAAHFNEEHHLFDNIVLCCIEANDTWTDGQRKTR